MKQQKENIENNEPDKLLSNMIEDYMYMSSKTYYNWYNKNSNLDNMPIMGNSQNWYQFETIDVPILTFSGSNETDNYLHLDILKQKAKNCPDFKYKIIENTDHFYSKAEEDVAKLVLDFIIMGDF